MSDVTIPGVNSSLNTDSIVSKLMELERIPLTRKEGELDTYKNEKTIWQELSRKLTKLEDMSRGLYGSNNPFNERIVESSNERVLTATAERGALEQEKEITVIKKASADRFLSDSISEDFEAPSGTYTFTVGDEEIDFNFRGGSINRLVERINSRGRDLIRAQIIKDSPDTSVMLIESTKEGAENKLGFGEGAAQDLAISSGIIKRSSSSMREVALTPAPGASGTVSNDDGSITLKSGASGKFAVTPPVQDNGKMVVEIELKINNLEEESWTAPAPPPGPGSPDASSISYGGISIMNSGSSVTLPKWQPPVPPENIKDMDVFFASGTNAQKGLPALRDSSQPQKITVNLADIGGRIDGIVFKNNNTYREITVSNIKIYDPDARGDWEPARAIDKASNSVVKVDGIEITRNSNTIDDLIPGVTLTVKGEDEEPVDLKISPDDEMIKDSIINFVGTYNRIQAELSILTSTDGAVISELDYFTADETETAKKNLGYFQGDSSLIQMKSRLQMLMMEPYSTDTDETLKLLSQIGISTNSGGFGGGVNSAKLRGYIEINEDKLDNVLATNLTGVKDLFGIDTNDDLIIDNGAAFKTQEFIHPYTSTNGIIAFRLTSLDSRIDRTQRDIANYELKLEDKEAELKNKYATMEGNINSMQSSTNALRNLGNNNN